MVGMPVGCYVAMGGADGSSAMAWCCWYAMGGGIVGCAVGDAVL